MIGAMTCSSCGAYVPPSVRFCSNCGAPASDPEATRIARLQSRALEYGGAAKPIYGFFGLFCHQDPDRSFQLFGQQFACCERCAAIYGSMALFGLLFAFGRRKVRRPGYVEMVLLTSPVVLDGMAVGSELYGGNAVMRVVTGSLFGLAMIWFLYPRFEAGFGTIRSRIETLFDRLVAQDRAKPLSA